MSLIVPTVLENDLSNVEQKLALLKGLTNYLQIDIIDHWPGVKDTVSLKKLSDSKLLKDFDFELHLMSKDPMADLATCQTLGAKTVFAQVERIKDQSEYIKACRSLGLKAGLALDLPSFLSKIDKNSYYYTDGILLMAVRAGAQGQKFSKKVLGKLKRLVRIKKNLSRRFVIAIDGGIKLQQAKWCLSNGANQLCVGSYLLTAKDIDQTWQELNQLCKS